MKRGTLTKENACWKCGRESETVDSNADLFVFFSNEEGTYCLNCLYLKDWRSLYQDGNRIGIYKQHGNISYQEDMDGWDCVIAVEVVRVGTKVSRKVVAGAICAEFTDQRGCDHDHDCCGCVRSTVTKVMPLAESNIYWVGITAARNI